MNEEVNRKCSYKMANPWRRNISFFSTFLISARKENHACIPQQTYTIVCEISSTIKGQFISILLSI